VGLVGQVGQLPPGQGGEVERLHRTVARVAA
jgi:hypothetical protein